MVQKLRETAKANLQATKAEKDNTQTVRLWLNQITPDNYQKKQAELRELLFGNRIAKDEEGYDESQPEFTFDEHKLVIVVQTIFRKAQVEHPYAGFYAELCTQICRLELLIRGMKPTLSQIKKCNFRKQMLQYCKESFDALLQTPLTEEKKTNETEEDRLERDIKKKHKLFGNIEFVGELVKASLVTEQIMQSVFNNLLGIDLETDSGVNDNTCEAAIRLITKLGITLEGRIREAKEDEKRDKLQASLKKIYDRLRELQTFDAEDPKNRVSLRIKILIKNMFADRDSGWLKSKDEDKRIQTKAAVEEQVKQKDQEKRKQDSNRRDDDYNAPAQNT